MGRCRPSFPHTPGEQPRSELSVGGTAHLAKGGSGLLKPSDLQPFLKEVQRVREGLADDASSAATKQVFEVPWTRDVGWRGKRREMQSRVNFKVIHSNSGP